MAFITTNQIHCLKVEARNAQTGCRFPHPQVFIDHQRCCAGGVLGDEYRFHGTDKNYVHVRVREVGFRTYTATVSVESEEKLVVLLIPEAASEASVE